MDRLFSDDIRAVLHADDQRRAACVRGDADALEKLFTPDFTYTHCNGLREGLADYLARIRDGKVDYTDASRLQANVRLYGEVAVVEGSASLTYRLQAQTGHTTLQTLYLAVWLRCNGSWQLAAYASTLA